MAGKAVILTKAIDKPARSVFISAPREPEAWHNGTHQSTCPNPLMGVPLNWAVEGCSGVGDGAMGEGGGRKI